MNRRSLAYCSILALFVIAASGWLLAQDNDDLQQGLKAYGTYRGGEFDSVSMTNGNLILDIPLFSYPQRGKVSWGYKLIYNGKNYKEWTQCLAGDCTTYVRLKRFRFTAKGGRNQCVYRDIDHHPEC